MAKVTDLGSAKPDDPIYKGGLIVGGKRSSGSTSTTPASTDGTSKSPQSGAKQIDPSSLPSPEMTEAEFVEWVRAQPKDIKRGTVEESLMKQIEEGSLPVSRKSSVDK